MGESRFIVLSVDRGRPDDDTEEVMWMLLSSNNRPLGRGAASFQTSQACRAAVSRLRQECRRILAVAMPTDGSRGWSWRADLDGAPVAVSTRSYLRHSECEYNLQRFLEAVPAAEVAPAVRLIRAAGP